MQSLYFLYLWALICPQIYLDMMKRLFLLPCLLLTVVTAFAQDNTQLVSGPMVGYCEMREALLWAQTNGPARVYFKYFTAAGDTFVTDAYQTRSSEGYVARLVANQVQPGTTYGYQVFVDGNEVKRTYALQFKTPPLWQYRTDPPAMKIAMGSCVYINDERYDRPGKPYGADYRIFESIHKTKPDLMLWLGDNVYYREADWYSRTGMVHRNTHTRATKEMQALLASTANYAIWDDHDFGPNDSDRTFRDKEVARELFSYFWGNPSYGVPGLDGGITTTFEWGDAQFFLLDDRYFRDPNNLKSGKRAILGEAQMDWFLHALASSTATFKVVCVGGQFLNTFPGYENFAAIAPEERQRIIDFIGVEQIRNVVFLTGDRHHSELSVIEKNGVKIYDFTVSPLTSGPHATPDEANALRVPGSHVGIRNFGTMEISGPRLARKFKLALFDTDGKPLWSQEFEADHRK